MEVNVIETNDAMFHEIGGTIESMYRYAQMEFGDEVIWQVVISPQLDDGYPTGLYTITGERAG
jgi:hypothetical protein